MIPRIPLIETPVRQLNERLWQLFAKSADGTLTKAERAEFDLMCATADAEQDNSPPYGPMCRNPELCRGGYCPRNPTCGD